MKTTGGSLGISTGKPRITNVGFNQDSRDKQGITRNTVVGDVEIAGAEGSPINRDLGKANEVTRDTHSSTNINVESQTIEYLTNPGKLKEDIGKAKEEINDIKWAIDKSIHDMGDDNRNFFGQLSEVRLDKSLENITSERLIGKTVDTEIADVFKDAYKDLGYDIEIIFSDPKNSPQLKDEDDKTKAGTAYVRDENGKKIKTIIINGEDPKNATKAGLIGTIVEEGSHVIGKVEGRQRKTGTDEKGLESTGRASNEYFAEKYKDDNTPISIHSDGKDYSNVDFGENVGDTASSVNLYRLVGALNNAEKVLSQNYSDKHKYFSVLKEVGKYAGHRVGSPYEALYLISKEGRKNVLNNNNLDIKSFDPEGWKIVEGRNEYKKAVESVKIKAKNIALNILREKPDTKYLERRSKGDIVSGFKLEGSEKIIDKKVSNTLEFALGSPVITGTALIQKNVKSNGRIDLKISVRYNLSDEFGDVYGIKEAQKKFWKILGLKNMPQLIPSEYGAPYGMLGPSKTEKILSEQFKSKKEYLKFLEGKY